MLTVVCWKWQPVNPLYRSKFNAGHVNVLFNMVKRNYRGPFRMVCITDDPTGITDRVIAVPLWDEFRHIPSPLGVDYPACYARLRAFDRDFSRIVGDRFVSIDLDCVIAGDITDLWSRSEDFVIWENNAFHGMSPGKDKPITPYNGSMWMMAPGARQKVYSDFDPVYSPIHTHNAGFVGSDQAWMAYCLGPNEAVWTKEDGVYSWRSHMKNRNYRLPADARIVFFQGHEDPWDQSAHDKAAWIKEHYR
jgi:hypothetical protein